MFYAHLVIPGVSPNYFGYASLDEGYFLLYGCYSSLVFFRMIDLSGVHSFSSMECKDIVTLYVDC